MAFGQLGFQLEFDERRPAAPRFQINHDVWKLDEYGRFGRMRLLGDGIRSLAE